MSDGERRNSATFGSGPRDWLLRRRVSSTGDFRKLEADEDAISMCGKDDLSQSRRSLLLRQDTFVIDADDVIDSDNEEEDHYYDQDEEEDEEEENLGKSTSSFLGKSTSSMVERGIRRMLEGADIDGVDSQVREEFSTEVRSYIASHFRMIREENFHLRKTIEERDQQLIDLQDLKKVGRQQRRELQEAQDELKKLTLQLDRERAKSKSMARKMMEINEKQPASLTNKKTVDRNDDIVWYGIPNPTSTSTPNVDTKPGTSRPGTSRPGTSMLGRRHLSTDDKINLSKSFDEELRRGSRPNSSILHSAKNEDSSIMSKRLKGFKSQTIQLKKELDHLKDILLREIGSESGVEEALHNEGGKWKGRAEKISDLEVENSRLKKILESGDHSNKMFESRLNSPDTETPNFTMQPRDNGDGSSRQESFSRQDEPGSTPSLTPIKISSNASQREMAIKLHEYRTICQVSEVERERLGEHVRVMSKKLRGAEEAARESELALREERRRTAHLERIVEKTRVELARSASQMMSPPSVLTNRLEDESRELRDRLTAYERQIRELELKNETDSEMYLKMLADTRRIFAQGLKINLDSTPNAEHWTEKVKQQ